jgi:hypothetical protein
MHPSRPSTRGGDEREAVARAFEWLANRADPVLEPAGDDVLPVRRDRPAVAAWIAAGDFDVVLLPARRRPLRSAKPKFLRF